MVECVEEPVAEGTHEPDRRRRARQHPVGPAPAGEPADHVRVVGDDRGRNIVIRPLDHSRRLLVSDDDQDRVLVPVVVDE